MATHDLCPRLQEPKGGVVGVLAVPVKLESLLDGFWGGLCVEGEPRAVDNAAKALWRFGDRGVPLDAAVVVAHRLLQRRVVTLPRA